MSSEPRRTCPQCHHDASSHAMLSVRLLRRVLTPRRHEQQCGAPTTRGACTCADPVHDRR